MTKKSTKRALISSILVLVLCFTMLIGTTFAWFTDSATSTGNKITTGNLDVELYRWDENGATNISKDKTPVFGADILWEPGYTEVVYLSIKNEGSLALKYQVAIEVKNVTKNLNEVMYYTITPGATVGNVTAWNQSEANAVKFGTNVTATNEALTPGAEHFFALSVHMDENAGNEYQNGTIEFDISIIAGQLAYEEDNFGKDYDKNATYPESGYGYGSAAPLAPGASAASIEVRNNDGYKVGSVVIPAAAAAGNEGFTANITKTDYYQGNFTVEAGRETAAYDVSVTGLKAGNTELIKVDLRIPAGLDPDTVKLYHKDEQIPCTYNPNTGYVTFETASFSPFIVVYDAESEYEAPAVDTNKVPTATVVYAPEYVGAGKITWGNYGDWSPTEGLDANLEAAFVFTAPEKIDPAFANWYCDFYVSLDKALGENQIFLGGNYGSFGWVGFHNGDLTLGANEEIGLLEGVTTNPWTYQDVAEYVGTFICGVGDVNNALEGATFTVKLRLTNPENENEYYDVNVVTYTFGVGSVIDGEDVVLAKDFDLNNPEDSEFLNNLFGGN